LIEPHQIFKCLRSDNEAERIVAANKMYASFKNSGGHPDDWELVRKGDDKQRRLADLEGSLRKSAEAQRQFAEADAAKERKAREKAEAGNAKLREQLNKARAAKAAPDPSERVDLLSGLLSQDTLARLSPEQIGEKMQTLYGDRDRRQHNIAAQVDLVIGQLTAALYQRYEDLYGKWRPRSNAPSPTAFLETHAGKSASWCRRCLKAYTKVTASDWNESCWDGTGGIEGIIRAGADPNRPKVKRVTKVQKRLDALTDAVRKKEWRDAEEMVNIWDNTWS
jgi:hypothetical protein